MNYKFRIVEIYVDSSGNLVFLPTGISEKLKGAIKTINLPTQLMVPYTSELIGKTALLVMEQCFSKSPDNDFKETILEHLYNIKGYNKAVKGRKLVTFEWREEEGYKIVPHDKIDKQGYVIKKDEVIYLGKDLTYEKLADALAKAIEISSTY